MQTELLKLELYKNKISQAKLAKQIGISEKSLSLKIQGKQDFWLREVKDICSILHIKDVQKIFF